MKTTTKQSLTPCEKHIANKIADFQVWLNKNPDVCHINFHKQHGVTKFTLHLDFHKQ